jgi:hypothetical protein
MTVQLGFALWVLASVPVSLVVGAILAAGNDSGQPRRRTAQAPAPGRPLTAVG